MSPKVIVTIVALCSNPGVHILQYVKPGHTCALYKMMGVVDHLGQSPFILLLVFFCQLK